MPITLTQIKDNQEVTTDLTKIKDVSELSTVLKAIQPSDNQTTRLITYALVATAITGIFVYHYIRQQEDQ